MQPILGDPRAYVWSLIGVPIFISMRVDAVIHLRPTVIAHVVSLWAVHDAGGATRFGGQLVELLRPSQLDITNDSWQHRHHAPMRAAGGGNGETRTSAFSFGYRLPYAFAVVTTRSAVRLCLTCLSIIVCADFSVHVVSEQFQGKVESMIAILLVEDVVLTK